MTGIFNGPIPDDFMTDISHRLSAAIFPSDDAPFEILDQLLLPQEKVYHAVKNSEDAYEAIKSMRVRGAPLIAVVGIRGLLLDLLHLDQFISPEAFEAFVHEKADFLLSSRPTAINLSNALEIAKSAAKITGDTLSKIKSVKEAILKIYHDEQKENRRLVWNGYQAIISLSEDSKKKFTMMTICNTGSLATTSWGTALGVIRALNANNRLQEVFALETRPYNQGIRLTATELAHGNVPFTVITDSMAAWTMKTRHIDAVIVGADQVALNGDTANKIGTYMLSVVAKHHKIPFYIAAPFTTINPKRETGESIPIEERPAIEMLTIQGNYLGSPSTPVWNPAFDVTPGELISAIITDFGNIRPADLEDSVRSHVNT